MDVERRVFRDLGWTDGEDREGEECRINQKRLDRPRRTQPWSLAFPQRAVGSH